MGVPRLSIWAVVGRICSTRRRILEIIRGEGRGVFRGVALLCEERGISGHTGRFGKDTIRLMDHDDVGGGQRLGEG